MEETIKELSLIDQLRHCVDALHWHDGHEEEPRCEGMYAVIDEIKTEDDKLMVHWGLVPYVVNRVFAGWEGDSEPPLMWCGPLPEPLDYLEQRRKEEHDGT